MHSNAALAKSHNKKDWRKGKPIRVVRGFMLKKTHPKYAPEVPPFWDKVFRYDGIYKVIEWGELKGETGFKVCASLLLLPILLCVHVCTPVFFPVGPQGAGGRAQRAAAASVNFQAMMLDQSLHCMSRGCPAMGSYLIFPFPTFPLTIAATSSDLLL